MPIADNVSGLRNLVAPSTETATETATATATISPPPNMTNFVENIGAAVGIVVNSLSKALTTVITSGGLLLVLLVAGLGFMFVMWAIRLIHLRGR